MVCCDEITSWWRTTYTKQEAHLVFFSIPSVLLTSVRDSITRVNEDNGKVRLRGSAMDCNYCRHLILKRHITSSTWERSSTQLMALTSEVRLWVFFFKALASDGRIPEIDITELRRGWDYKVTGYFSTPLFQTSYSTRFYYLRLWSFWCKVARISFLSSVTAILPGAPCPSFVPWPLVNLITALLLSKTDHLSSFLVTTITVGH